MTFKTKPKPTFSATLTLVGQGVEQKLPLVYRHKSTSEYQDLVKELVEAGKVDTDLVLALVESWDADAELTTEGLTQLQDDMPGVLQAIIEAYGPARLVGQRKN